VTENHGVGSSILPLGTSSPEENQAVCCSAESSVAVSVHVTTDEIQFQRGFAQEARVDVA
jgi:hypothetical protein